MPEHVCVSVFMDVLIESNVCFSALLNSMCLPFGFLLKVFVFIFRKEVLFLNSCTEAIGTAEV